MNRKYITAVAVNLQVLDYFLACDKNRPLSFHEKCDSRNTPTVTVCTGYSSLMRKLSLPLNDFFASIRMHLFVVMFKIASTDNGRGQRVIKSRPLR